MDAAGRVEPRAGGPKQEAEGRKPIPLAAKEKFNTKENSASGIEGFHFWSLRTNWDQREEKAAWMPYAAEWRRSESFLSASGPKGRILRAGFQRRYFAISLSQNT
jgi:hypothetical protein